MKKWVETILVALFIVVAAFANAGNKDCCEQGEGGFLTLDVFVWKACRPGMDFALEANTTNLDLVEGRIHEASFNWDFGFRADLGYRLACDRWNICLEYTHFRSKAIGSVADINALSQPFYYPTRIHPLIIPGFVPFESASMKFEVGYDVVDVLLGHSYCPCPSFELRPFAGIRGLFLSQDMLIDYTGGGYESIGDRLIWRAEYDAFGLHGGTGICYHVCGDFSLGGSLGASIVVGEPDGYQRQDKKFPQQMPETMHVDVMEKEKCLVSCGCDASIGVMWEGHCGDAEMALAVGYEFHRWNNIPEIRRFYDLNYFTLSSGIRNASLGFHGGFFRGRVDF